MWADMVLAAAAVVLPVLHAARAGHDGHVGQLPLGTRDVVLYCCLRRHQLQHATLRNRAAAVIEVHRVRAQV